MTSYLGKKKISEVDLGGKIIRSVSRKQIAQVFRGTIRRVDGLHPTGQRKVREQWTAHYGSKYDLSIGCKLFNRSTTEKIRKWAFARRKKA